MEATDLNQLVDEIMIKDYNSVDGVSPINTGGGLSKWSSLASEKS